MSTRRQFLSLCSAFLVLCVDVPAHAELLTATFTGIAYGYDNTNPAYPYGHNFITDASGSLVFDPSQISFNGFYYSGPGVELTFNVWNHTFVYGGIGEDPLTMPDGSFWPGSTTKGQSISFVGGNGGCGSLCSAGLLLSGPSGAFGPDDLTPETFHPGTVFLDGSSVGSFGTRELGAQIYLTSIRFSPSTAAIPEPSANALILTGLGLLMYAAYRRREDVTAAAVRAGTNPRQP